MVASIVPTARFVARLIYVFFLQASPHFLMTRPAYRLVAALALSLIFHLLPLASEFLHSRSPSAAPAPPPLRAEFRAPPPAMPPPPPPLIAPPPPKPAAAPATTPKPPKPAPAPRATGWLEQVRQQFARQRDLGLYYPTEAIAQGLEGEVLVLMLLDESGQVSAARVEQSSGQRLLDDAALRAVRALRSLPADAPRQALLPVRFRLH
jgi:protein TonB